MENETIHIAKLIAWEKMRETYRPFGENISKALTSPELQAIQETLRAGEPPSEPGPALDWLSEAVLRKSYGSLRGPLGKIETSAAKISKALVALREATERLETYPEETRLEGEMTFREWLQRGIVSTSAIEEPNILSKEDPIQKALGIIQELEATGPAYKKSDEDISFPLSSYEIIVKPKTPCAIEPFDDIELEGGGEEDTCMIISGESNIGKSHLGLFCLSSLSLRKEAVLLCSGEDSLATTRRRIFAHYLRAPARDIALMSELDRENAFNLLYGDKEDPESLHFHIAQNLAVACVPEGSFHPKTIEEKIDAFEQKRGRHVKAFMADYLQKMSENPTAKSTRRQRDEDLEFTVNQIKAICQKRKTFGIIISQVPSHAAGGATEFLNLRQAVARSYAATWGAHYVVTMNRTAEETKRLASSNDKRPRLNLFLCKNKDGPLGVCYALGYPQEARWEFYRTKAEMLSKIEGDSLTEESKQLDPDKFRNHSSR